MPKSMKYMELNYREISCQKAVSGADFTRGNQDYFFSTSYPTTWIPSASYFRMSLSVTDATANAPPNNASNFAFAENAANNMYNNVYVRLAGQDISSIINFAPQASILKQRYSTSGSVLDKVKKSVMMIDPSFYNRQKLLSSNAAVVPSVDSQGLVLSKRSQDILFQPPVAIFDYDEEMPSGEYRISMNPNTDILAALQGDPLNAANTASVTVTDVKLYIATVTLTEPVPRLDFRFKLGEINIQAKPIVAGSNTLDFQVPASTYALAWFVQQTDAGTSNANVPNKVSLAQFLSSDSDAATPNPAPNTYIDKRMTNYQITYSNQTKPSTRYSTVYNVANAAASNNQYMLRYMTNLIENNLIDNQGGAESLEDYLERGPYYLHSFIRDKDDKSTQVQLSVTFNGNAFSTAAGSSTTSCFLAALYYKETEAIVENGRVQSIKSLNM